MVVAGDVGFQVGVQKLHEVSQDFALDMEGARDVKLMVAPGVLRGKLGCASLMGVDAVVNTRDVPRVRKGALCFARHMEAGSVAHLQGVLKVQKGAHHCARHMAGGNVASSMVVVFAQRVYMEAQTSVLLMVVERGVLLLAAPKVHVAVLIAA